jgi:peptide deformylase
VSVLDEVRLLGDPALRRRSEPVGDVRAPAFRTAAARLHEALAAFRARHGFGRAIAAPQLGIGQRIIACNLGDGPCILADPRITWRSRRRFTLWDDCMSFPGLLVRVRRHASINLEWRDETGSRRCWEGLDRATSELFQHEIDHLDGVLAVDRAVDRASLVLRQEFQRDPARFEAMVDGVTD